MNALQQIMASQDSCLWLGSNSLQPIDFESSCTLARDKLMSEIIDRLARSYVAMIMSPPETGKSTLAVLVGRVLFEKGKRSNNSERILVASFFAVGLQDAYPVAFKSLFGVSWHDLVLHVPAERIVFLIVDDVHALYVSNKIESPASAPRPRPPEEFWNLVKEVMSDKAIRVRMLLVAEYGPSFEFVMLCSRIQIDPELIFDMQHLNFHQEKIVEFVKKRIVGFESLQSVTGNGSAALDAICTSLKALTEGRTGLCAAQIGFLNTEITTNQMNLTPASILDKLRGRISGALH